MNSSAISSWSPPRFRASSVSLFHQVPVDRHLGGVKKKRRIGGGVLRPVPGNGFDITRVRYNGRVFLQGFKQRHCFLLIVQTNSLELLAIVRMSNLLASS